MKDTAKGFAQIRRSYTYWSRFLGAQHVVVSDLVAARGQQAIEFGATEFVDASAGEVPSAVEAVIGGRPDTVFECVGLPGTFQQAVELVANDGVVVVAGLCMAADTFLPTVALIKAIDVRFTMCYERRHFETILKYMGSGRIDVSKFVTGTVGLDDFCARFESLKQAGSDIKVMLDPSAK